MTFLSHLTRIGERARVHMAEGLRDTGERSTVLKLLNDMLACELVWLMRYRRHYVMAGGVAAVSMDRSYEDETSADRLARRIVEMGGEPDLDPDDLLTRRRSAYAPRGSVEEMVREDLQAERMAIAGYADVIGFLGDSDPATCKALQTNLDCERARAADLGELLLALESPRDRHILPLR